MKAIKCPNGHFYDADSFNSCPHCKNTASTVPNLQDNPVTVMKPKSPPPAANPGPTVMPGYLNGGVPPTIPPQHPHPDNATPTTDPVTIGLSRPSAPVVGWLVCTKGMHRGKDFRLRAGINFVGRSETMDVCLRNENSVSREKHALIIYDPKQNAFLAQMGESRELFYVNDQLITSAVVLKKHDVLQIGKVELMLFPCCDENFKWEDE